MTLRELLSKTSRRKEEKTPSINVLLNRGERIIAKHEQVLHGEILLKILVFESGYVLYQEGSRRTVFHIEKSLKDTFEYRTTCEEKTPVSQRSIPQKVLLDAEWQVCLILEGNRRIMNNRYAFQKKKQLDFQNLIEICPECGFNKSLFDEIEKKEFRERLNQLCEYLQGELTEKQWTVFVRIEREQQTEDEIAKTLNKAQSAVSQNYSGACKKISKRRELLKELYWDLYEDLFRVVYEDFEDFYDEDEDD